MAGMTAASVQGLRGAGDRGSVQRRDVLALSLPTTADAGHAWQSCGVSGNVAVLGTAPAAGRARTAANALVTDAAQYAAAAYSSAADRDGAVSVAELRVLHRVVGDRGVAAGRGRGHRHRRRADRAGQPGVQRRRDGEHVGGSSGRDVRRVYQQLAGARARGRRRRARCEEAFDSWPAMFTPVAYDAASDAAARRSQRRTACQGQPYVLLGSPVIAATQALAPSTAVRCRPGRRRAGGEPGRPGRVAGAGGGSGEHRERGLHPVRRRTCRSRRSGRRWISPAPMTRRRRSSRQQTGTPGPMGYGWTDNWASSLTTARPVPGDIYTLAGLRTDTGQGGPPAQRALNNPGEVLVSAGRIPTSSTPAATGSRRSRARRRPSGASPMTAGTFTPIAGQRHRRAGRRRPNGTAAASSLLDAARRAGVRLLREPVHRRHRQRPGGRDPGGVAAPITGSR